MFLKVKVTVPTAETGLTYNGNAQRGVATGSNYTLTGATATNAGEYTATAQLNDKNNYEWEMAAPTSENQTIKWSIAAKTVNVKADNKSTYAGENCNPLTYEADALIGTDSYSGELACDATTQPTPM